MPITTNSGREFRSAEAAVQYLRECANTIQSPDATVLAQGLASIEMAYTFQALDEYLCRSGTLPIGWARAMPPGGEALLTRHARGNQELTRS